MEFCVVWIHHSEDGGWPGNKDPIRATVGGTQQEPWQDGPYNTYTHTHTHTHTCVDPLIHSLTHSFYPFLLISKFHYKKLSINVHIYCKLSWLVSLCSPLPLSRPCSSGFGWHPSTSFSLCTSPLSRAALAFAGTSTFSLLISCSGASWDSSSRCQIFVLGEQLIWSWVHAPIHTGTRRVISAQVGFSVCWCVYLCIRMIVELRLIPVCIFLPSWPVYRPFGEVTAD